jgi:hypothetical protein
VRSSLPSDGQTMTAIEQRLIDILPPGWNLRSQRTPTDDHRADVAWTLTAPGGDAAVFAVKITRAALGRRLDAVLAELDEADGLPLVAAPFLSTTLRDTLAARGISYADATGNQRLVAGRPGLFVECRGAAKDPWPTDDTLRSLRGRAAGRAVRALVDFQPPFGVRDLSKRASVPLGSLSRTLDLLDREGLVSRGARGEVNDLDWEGAIRRWGQDYSFVRSNRAAHYFVAGGLEAMTRILVRPKRPYAVTGAVAAQRFAPTTAKGPVVLYVEDLDLAAERLGLGPATSEANVVLVEGYDPVVFERPVLRDRIRMAAPSQVAVDLLTDPGSDPTTVDELFAWMRATPEAWRTTT